MTPLRVALLDRIRGLDSGRRYEELLASQYADPEELRQRQASKLGVLLRAAATAPHYAARAGDAARNPWDVLRGLPILTRAEARAQAARIWTADARPRGAVRAKATGGSTGEPLRYGISAAAQATQWAMLWRAWNAAGYTPGAPLGIVAGRALLAGEGWKRRVYAGLQNWTTLDAFDLNEAAMARFARALTSGRVAYLYGYASALETFARWLEATSHHPRLRAVFTTAEQLLPAARAAIERGAGAPVFDTYGANDGGISAFECGAHQGLHLGVERCIVEVVQEDGSPAPPGEVGRVVATDLENLVFPFLRYEVGDLAALDASPCSCGRTLPRLVALAGRISDVLVLPDGRRVHGEVLSHLLRAEGEVLRFQAIQTSPRSVEVRVRLSEGAGDAALARIRPRIAALLPGLQVALIQTDDLRRTAAGKAPLVIGAGSLT